MGGPIELRLRAELLTTDGAPAHAATDVRRRRIFLERCLTTKRGVLSRILVHELFHFAWVRIGNARRWSWEELLSREIAFGARGELGYSSESRKKLLTFEDVLSRNRRWRDYCCESFCDSAAWQFSGAESVEFTLAAPWRRRRADWLRNYFPRGERIRL